MSADDRIELAQMLASRICHDLISPIGALANGVELAAMTARGPEGEEMALIRVSSAHASARARFLRIAFGCAGEGSSISAEEIRDILAQISSGGRIAFHWQAPGDVPRSEAQLGFLAMLCLEGALPRGGTVTVTRDATGLVATATGDAVRKAAPGWQALGEGTRPPLAGPADVQFAVLDALARSAGLAVTLTDGEDRLSLRLERGLRAGPSRPLRPDT